MKIHLAKPVPWALIGVLVSVTPLATQAQPRNAGTAPAKQLPLTLKEAIARALKNNLTLKAARADLSSARAGLIGARIATPFNPELSGTLGGRFAAKGKAFEVDVALSQKFEIGGQRGKRIALARARVATRKAAENHLRDWLKAKVKVAFTDALLARRLMGFARQTLKLANQLHQTAIERRKAGAATDLEVNLAGIEWAQARRALAMSKRKVFGSLIKLRNLLGFSPSRTLEIKGRLSLPARFTTRLAPLLRLALSRRRDLKALDQQRLVLEAEKRLARAEAWPNLTFSLKYAHEEGESHIAGVGFSIPLPLFNRNQGRIAQARARARRAMVALEQGRMTVQQEVAKAFHGYRMAHEVTMIYSKDILTQTESNLKLLRASLEAGKIGLMQVLLLQRDLWRTRREYVESLSKLHQSLARLELAVGGELR